MNVLLGRVENCHDVSRTSTMCEIVPENLTLAFFHIQINVKCYILLPTVGKHISTSHCDVSNLDFILICKRKTENTADCKCMKTIVIR